MRPPSPEPPAPKVRKFLDEVFSGTQRISEVFPLKGDASTRRYLRCVNEQQGSWILTIYPSAIEEDRFSYREIHDLLRRIGIPVPKILAVGAEQGLVLQEDLGDLSLEHLALESPVALRRELRKALDYIPTMQVEGSRRFTPDFVNYSLRLDEDRLQWELDYFLRHYVRGFRGLRLEHRTAMEEEFRRIVAELDQAVRVFCHRDYQVRNLIVREGTLYAIDFQDARWGPPSYDLVSLLKDSIALDAAAIEEGVDRYLTSMSRREFGGLPGEVFQPKPFMRQFHLMCIQRLLKALGTYGYQIAVRGISSYRRLVPGTLERALVSLEALSEFPAARKLVEEELREI